MSKAVPETDNTYTVTETRSGREVGTIEIPDRLKQPYPDPVFLPVPEGATFADGTRLRQAIRFPLSCEYLVSTGARGIYSAAIRVQDRGTDRLSNRIVCILSEDDEQAVRDFEELLAVVQSEEGERREEHEVFAGCVFWCTRRWDDVYRQAKEIEATIDQQETPA